MALELNNQLPGLVKEQIQDAIDEITTAVDTLEADVTTLEGLVNGVEILNVSIEDAANAAASTAVTITGVAATDVAMAVGVDYSNGSATFVKTAVCTTNTVTVTFDANTATGDKFSLIVMRPAS